MLAGGRGLGTFKSGLKGGVHIVPRDKVEEIAGTRSFLCLFSQLCTSHSDLVPFTNYHCNKLFL